MLNNPETWRLLVTIIAAAVSIVAARFAWVAAKRARVVQVLTFLQKTYTDIRAWADQVVEAMSEATLLCDLDPQKTTSPDFFARRHQLRVKLSTLIDRGRWFFPNTHHEQVGIHNHTAYRGIRPAAMDAVVAVFDLVGSLDYKLQAPNVSRRSLIVDHKRQFVSEIQNVLDPRERETEMEVVRGDI